MKIFWGTFDINDLIYDGEMFFDDVPSNKTLPFVGLMNPIRISTNVLFPIPDSPLIQILWPFFISTEIFSNREFSLLNPKLIFWSVIFFENLKSFKYKFGSSLNVFLLRK